MEKICYRCNVKKSNNDFFKRKSSKDGLLNHCIECDRVYKKEYRKKNPDKTKKEYNNYISKPENKERESLRLKEYYKKNKNRISERNKKKRQTDPLYKLKHNSRAMIRDSFRYKGYKKNSKTATILGCTFEQLKTHLEGEFKDWMNWDNHGLYNGELNYGWDIDHIIPLATAKNEGELIKLNHYTNLQPLCSKINRDIKRGRI